MPFLNFLIYLKNKIMSYFRYDEHHITIKEMNRITNEFILLYDDDYKYSKKHDKELITY